MITKVYNFKERNMEGKRMKFKTLALFVVFLAAFMGFSALASAAEACDATSSFNAYKVEVNGVDVSRGSTVYVEAGETVPVVVYLQGTKDSYNTRVSAWVGGYEYSNIEAETDIFQVLDGVSDRKVLLLDMPKDMETEDEYTLNVEVYNDDVSCKNSYTLRVEAPRHDISVFDTILNPGSVVTAGQPLFVSVRVENLGDNSEDSVKVTARISQLGLESSDYLDTLVTQNEDKHCDGDCKASASANDLVLMIPSATLAGDYQLDVLVTYNRGHSMAKKSYVVKILPAAQQIATQATNALVNVDTSSLTTAAGEGAVYKLSLANLGDTTQTYTFDVAGVSGWGVYSVDPQTLTLGKDQTGVANLYVSPSSDTAAGLKTFNVKVKAGADTVKELTLNMNVAENQNSYDLAKKVLLIVFVVLLIILIILGIIVAAKKLGGKEQSETGQAYY